MEDKIQKSSGYDGRIKEIVMFEVFMDRKTNKNKRRKKHNMDDFEIEQDENFSFIAGCTSGGFPYGNPWEETDDNQNEVKDVFI